MIKSIRQQRQRPSLKVLNKSDLADPKVTLKWIEFFNKLPNTYAIAISAKNKSDVNKILPAALKIAPHRGTLIKPLRMMIMGVPNVGKSTIINTLKNKKIAKVGNEPGVTKSVQRLELNEHTILTDTPGMMWPKIDNELDGFLLAASHTIGINAYDEIETALVLYEVIKKTYTQNISEKYKMTLSPLPNDEAFLELLAKNRGFIIGGGKYNLQKAASTFLSDYRLGRIGQISLEEPENRYNQ